ncbi:hypothetical protein J5N97_006217 [Dioscorea zingiberensis]|uniref:Uncharacterized protein n=1 Tax=Dioscorea zingiberensis TaxID=325984 RepID=A0A9D5D9M3_9LILI|nr:hypothetical protein J5N97_006217 [Dioscorea zingiberensis]
MGDAAAAAGRREGRAEKKWQGSVGGVVCAPVGQVWAVVSQSSRLSEWMPMVENCTRLSGEEGVAGYVRLVSGFMFPQEDGDRSWIKERLLLMDPASFSYVYRMEASNVGLDGSVNSLQLIHYGDDSSSSSCSSTLVHWSFEIDAVEGASEETIIDYLAFLYKSCINRIEGAIHKKGNNNNTTTSASEPAPALHSPTNQSLGGW